MVRNLKSPPMKGQSRNGRGTGESGTYSALAVLFLYAPCVFSGSSPANPIEHPATSIELFVAIPINPAAQITLAKATLKNFAQNKKQQELCLPLQPAHYHLSLSTVYTANTSKVPQLLKQLHLLAKTHPVFAWSPSTMTAFPLPAASPPALVVTGPSTPPLTRLQAAIQKVMLLSIVPTSPDTPVLPPPFPFVPHITVALCSQLSPTWNFSPHGIVQPIRMDSFTFYESDALTGVVKRVIHFPLRPVSIHSTRLRDRKAPA